MSRVLAPPPRPATWLAATRPGFLSISVVGWLLGTANAYADRIVIDPLNALLALLGALLAHAGANAVNDAADADNGSDAANTDRIGPFTGGSRLIQNGELSAHEMRRFGLALLAGAALCGGVLLLRGPLPLLAFGLAGLALAWAYSTPPLQLMCRGLGEFAVGLGWALIVAGSDFLQRGQLAASTLSAAAGFGLAVATVLLINGIPDRRADAAAGKRTLVVRLGVRRTIWLYAALAGAMFALPLLSIGTHRPWLLALPLLATPVSWRAILLLRDNVRHEPADPALRNAIQFTLLAAHAYGLVWAAALFIARATA